MNKIYLIFDYFKQAFHVNKNNKTLYKPQILFIVIKLMFFWVIGYFLYSWISNEQMVDAIQHDVSNITSYTLSFWSLFIIALVIILTLVIIARIVEAGLYNMYKRSVTDGETSKGDFWEGVSKYFFKFLFGDILIIIAWMIFLIPFVIIGIFTLTIGFAVIPLIIEVFLTMWKISLVMNDSGIIDAFKDSINFAKRNFAPLFVLQLIHWSFVKSSGGGFSFNNISNLVPRGSSSSGSSNTSGSFGTELPGPQELPGSFGTDLIPNKNEIVDTIVQFIKVGMLVVIPVVTIAYTVSALITMIIEVFFSLALFVAYNNNFEPETIQPNEEVVL